jgi:hypothetical protein
MDALPVAIHNLELEPSCHLTSRHIPKSMKMREILGERVSLKTSRVVCLIVSPIVSHLSTICSECKPFLLGFDPQGLVGICESHVCRMRHAKKRM